LALAAHDGWHLGDLVLATLQGLRWLLSGIS